MLCICTIVGCEKYGKLNNGKLRCQMGKKFTTLPNTERAEGLTSPACLMFIKIGKTEEILMLFANE